MREGHTGSSRSVCLLIADLEGRYITTVKTGMNIEVLLKSDFLNFFLVLKKNLCRASAPLGHTH